MPDVAAILRFSAVVILVCGCVSAQSRVIEDPAPARKFDEFGSLGHCDLTARLDNLTISVENTPGAYAQIITYAPPGVGERLLELIKEYLVNTRGLAARRIKTTYGGRNSDLIEPKIELWIVPKGARPAEPAKQETNVDTFKGLLASRRRADDFGVEIIGEMGPGIGVAIGGAFADILNQQKNAIGYLVVYSGEDLTPGAWKSIAQEEINYLQGVDSSRVKTIFGGHQKETSVQFWISPKDAPPPVADAGPEQPPARTVKAGEFSAYDLAKEKNQTNLFKRLTEILRTEKAVRAFVVVRLEVPTPVDTTEEPAANEPDAEEPSSEPIDIPEPADLTKLVEKWRVELANTHKIGADRFIIVFTTAPEFVAGSLGVWIVPKGQPLPNPNEDEGEPDAEPPPR